MTIKPTDVGVIAGIERLWQRIFVSGWRLIQKLAAGDHTKSFAISVDPDAPHPRWFMLDSAPGDSAPSHSAYSHRALSRCRAEIKVDILISNRASSPIEIIRARLRCATKTAEAAVFATKPDEKLGGALGARRTIASGSSATFAFLFLLKGVRFVRNEVAHAIIDVSDRDGNVQRLPIELEPDWDLMESSPPGTPWSE